MFNDMQDNLWRKRRNGQVYLIKSGVLKAEVKIYSNSEV